MSNAESTRTEKLLDVSRKLAATGDLQSILSVVIDALRDLLQAERATVFEFDPKAMELFTQVAHGIGDVAGTPNVIRIPMSAGIAGAAATSKQIINIADAYADDRFNRSVDLKTGYRTRTILAVPLLDHDGALVGVAQVLNRHTGTFTAADESLASGLAANAAVAMKRGRLIEDRIERERLEREMDVAKSIQAGTFPTDIPHVSGWDIAGESCPAEFCGGDAYDVIALAGGSIASPDTEPDEYVFAIADATGHGVASALSSVQMRGMLRLGLRLRQPIVKLAEEINAQLCEDLPDGRFVTAWLARLDCRSGDVHTISAGQGPILIYSRASDTFVTQGADMPPLGVVPLPYSEDDAQRYTLASGDILVAITDGFYEAASPERVLFDEERIRQIVRSARDQSSREILDAIKREVHAFTQHAPLEDDQTGLIIKRL
ncbi:MAG: GAF domain-containing protein [Planctomycetota bacterium]|nr:MAG: GAF domain-containing protein [Planctomycetota bacterium]